MARGTPDRWTGLRGLGGVLVALGVLPLAFSVGLPGWAGVALFVAEIALIVVGAGLLLWAGRRERRGTDDHLR